jgi:hypothetical protein
VSNVVLVEADSAAFANVLATVCKTAAASVRYFVTAYGAFVASDVDNLDDVGVLFVSADRELNAFAENCSFLVYAATHCGFVAGNDLLGDIHHTLEECAVPREACNLTQNLIF